MVDIPVTNPRSFNTDVFQKLISDILNGKVNIGNAYSYGTPQQDYDLNSYYNYSKQLSPQAANGHFTDLYKLPNHETFSNESAYANGTNQPLAGSWSSNDSYNITPAKLMQQIMLGQTPFLGENRL